MTKYYLTIRGAGFEEFLTCDKNVAERNIDYTIIKTKYKKYLCFYRRSQ